MEKDNTTATRKLLAKQRDAHRKALQQELARLTRAAAKAGLQCVILFGSMLRGEPSLHSDLELLIVWDTPLPFLERTVELYRRLQPRVATDLWVYTPG